MGTWLINILLNTIVFLIGSSYEHTAYLHIGSLHSTPTSSLVLKHYPDYYFSWNIQSLFLDSWLENPSLNASGLSQKEFSSWKSYNTLSLGWVLLPLSHFTGIKCLGAFVNVCISLFVYCSFYFFCVSIISSKKGTKFWCPRNIIAGFMNKHPGTLGFPHYSSSLFVRSFLQNLIILWQHKFPRERSKEF